MKIKGRKAFWRNIKFKYKLSITNENTLEEVFGFHVSKLNGLSVLLSACIIIFLIAAVIIVFTPLRNYLPGYMNSNVRSQIVDNALRADSLRQALEKQERYVMSIRNILSGQIKADSVNSIDSLAQNEELIARSKAENEFRDKYEAEERYNLTAVTDRNDVAGLVFYRPVRGVITSGFSPEEKHFGIDVTAQSRENILAALDGTVIFAAYTAEWEYVIQIQHEQDFVTVYKHCGVLMRQEGDKVKAGEVIALSGSGENQKAHLHYELWHKGNPVNPEKYVVF